MIIWGGSKLTPSQIPDHPDPSLSHQPNSLLLSFSPLHIFDGKVSSLFSGSRKFGPGHIVFAYLSIMHPLQLGPFPVLQDDFKAICLKKSSVWSAKTEIILQLHFLWIRISLFSPTTIASIFFWYRRFYPHQNPFIWLKVRDAKIIQH